MLQRLIRDRWFAIIDLSLVILSGIAWMVTPTFALWFTLLALLPWTLRFLGKAPPFQRTPFDWVIVIFLVTTWVGYWASYDKTTAWTKAWLIVTAILLYFALSAQPKQNLSLLSFLSLGFAVCLSIHFFMTYTPPDNPGRFALWWINHRPEVHWLSISPGYTSGLIAIAGIYASYGIWDGAKRPNTIPSIIGKLLLALAIAILLSAFLLTMSRGILVAAVAVAGVWFLWKILVSSRPTAQTRAKALFPISVVLYLSALIILAYLMLARVPEGTTQSNYGDNSRADVLGRSAYFLVDYPITGAGLNSFPGLYSQYMIVIPSPYFMNSYNLFLDVAIEQGPIGGFAFIFLYVGSLWLLSQAIVRTSAGQMRFFSWLSLIALIVTLVHGFFYDYLYNGRGTLLLFLPVGISMIGILGLSHSPVERVQSVGVITRRDRVASWLILIPVTVLIVFLALNRNKLISDWYANLGAVQMSQIELEDFPTNQWVGIETAPDLRGAEALFRSALQYDPANQTATYRLGLISMTRQDFESASMYLERAHAEIPHHRGIIKTLGYCYVWLGSPEKASLLLAQIPEARHELETYSWWWETQHRTDLAEKASIMVSRLE